MEMPEEERPATIELAAGGASLRIMLIGRPLPDAEIAWDRDQIDAVITAEALPFAGTFTTSVWSHELEALRNVLLRLIGQAGKAAQEQFSLRERTLTMEFSGKGRGVVDVKVDVTPTAAGSPHLLFHVAADQTFLRLWVDAINRALRQFPREFATRPR